MPTFREMQQLYANIGTIGQQIKKQSDDAMEATWNNSIASRVCYIYDYYHDDSPTRSKTWCSISKRLLWYGKTRW